MTSVASKKAAPAKKSTAKGKSLKDRLKERGRKQDAMLIVPLIKENPCGEGTFCYAQVNAVLKSKTVADAKKMLAADPKNPTRNRSMEVGWMIRQSQ